MSICCVGSCLNDVMHCDTLGLGSRYRYIPRALLLVLRSGDEVCTDKFCTDVNQTGGRDFVIRTVRITRPLYSVSQPGCRDTLGCRKEVLGVPPILIFQWTFGLF